MNSFRFHVHFLRWHFGHTIPMIMHHASLYPELPRKSFLRRFLDNVYLYIRDGSPCVLYDGFGLDIKGSDLKAFVSRIVWKKLQYRRLTGEGLGAATLVEKLGYNSTMPTYVMQEKFCFYVFLEKHGIPVIPVLARSVDGKIYDFTSKDRPLSSYDRLFIKLSNSLGGNGARILTKKDGRFYDKDQPVELDSLLNEKNDFIVQPVLENHNDIKALNPTSLNTLRIVTCRTKSGEYELWDPGMIRIGRRHAVIDNFTQGGMGVGLTEDGKLKRYGYSHDRNFEYFKMERHPDSQILFDGYEIPFYKEAVELLLKTHKLFPQLQTIGWDVAITEDGPVLVEGNHDWGIEMLQVVQHKGSAARLREIYGDLTL